MLSEEVRRFVGKGIGVCVYEVEKGAIMRFADAVGDPNPLYSDEESARDSKYRSIITPPGFFGWPAKAAQGNLQTSPVMLELRDTLVKAGFHRSLDGGVDYEFYIPIRVNDTLAASLTIKEIVEREGKSGNMVFVTVEAVYVNQHGDTVARALAIGIHR